MGLPPELVIGSVFKTVTDSSEQADEQNYVVLPNGVAKVNDTTAAALRATNSYGLVSPPSMEPSAVARIVEQVYDSPLPDAPMDVLSASGDPDAVLGVAARARRPGPEDDRDRRPPAADARRRR